MQKKRAPRPKDIILKMVNALPLKIVMHFSCSRATTFSALVHVVLCVLVFISFDVDFSLFFSARSLFLCSIISGSCSHLPLCCCWNDVRVLWPVRVQVLFFVGLDCPPSHPPSPPPSSLHCYATVNDVHRAHFPIVRL